MSGTAYTNERIYAILEHLKKERTASTAALARKLYVSEATVRRDLKAMQKMGMIERSHGGAIYYEASDEVSIFVRVEKNAKEKEETASIALRRLPDFSCAFIDNSSTCLALAERMNLSYKTIITNGLEIASKLSRKENVNVIMPGGTVHFNTNSVNGSMTVEALGRFKVDVMLSSCAALHDGGTYENSLETMQLKRKAFEISEKRYLLADSFKFDGEAMYKTRDVSEYDAVFTNALGEAADTFLKAYGANVINS